MQTRDFTDAAGRTWSVRQFTPTAPPTLLSSAHAEGWLTFERDDGERRRLVPAPDGWQELTEDALRAALEAARPVARASDLPGFEWVREHEGRPTGG